MNIIPSANYNHMFSLLLIYTSENRYVCDHSKNKLQTYFVCICYTRAARVMTFKLNHYQGLFCIIQGLHSPTIHTRALQGNRDIFMDKRDMG